MKPERNFKRLANKRIIFPSIKIIARFVELSGRGGRPPWEGRELVSTSEDFNPKILRGKCRIIAVHEPGGKNVQSSGFYGQSQFLGHFTVFQVTRIFTIERIIGSTFGGPINRAV